MANAETTTRPLRIFVHRASDFLTDHESHGDGLICFSLLNGLAERGHTIYAYTNNASIDHCSPNLHVKVGKHRLPANSLASLEFAWQANRWFEELSRTEPFDLIWRMHPYHEACPIVPQTHGKPLIVGPMFYGWPKGAAAGGLAGSPRFGFSIEKYILPAPAGAENRTLEKASMLIAATEPHAEFCNRRRLERQ